MLRRIQFLAVVLAVTVAAASPAAAQGVTGAESGSGDGSVTVTFQLSVDGQVPGWQHFGVDYPVGGETVGDVPLCTTDTDTGMAAPPCESGGVYTASVEVPAGTPVAFDFVRNDTRTAPERFSSETQTFMQNTTVSAAYQFPGAEVSGAPVEEAVPAGSEVVSPPSPQSGSSAVQGTTGAVAATDADTETGEAGVISSLPDTGGVAVVLLGAGAVATATGLLFYRRTR